MMPFSSHATRTRVVRKIYEACVAHELRKIGLGVARQIEIPIRYDGITFEEGLRLDLLVENKVIVEIKAVEIVNPVWQAQVLSHLRLTGLRLGYLLNLMSQKLKWCAQLHCLTSFNRHQGAYQAFTPENNSY